MVRKFKIETPGLMNLFLSTINDVSVKIDFLNTKNSIASQIADPPKTMTSFVDDP
jgi:hypothetical protein